MYQVLFALSGVAVVSWLLLIFLPGWRVTKWLVRTALFPLILAGCYTFGLVYYVVQHGAGFAADFATYEGVVQLLKRPEVAVIAWIHILAFDQLVGRMIYLDNMEKKYVPVTVQSLFLFMTLMVGPFGYLAYAGVKWLVRRSRREKRKTMTMKNQRRRDAASKGQEKGKS